MLNRTRSRLRLAAAAVAVCAVASAAPGQQYGQWTWDGRITGRQRSYEFLESDQVVSELRERGALLSLGVNGYVIHPAVAAFRLALDTNLDRHSGGVEIGSRKLGYRGDFRIFPTGVYPLHLYLSRQNYTYSFDDPDAPAARFGTIPADITTFGARLRVRSGPLTGLIARSERSRITLLGTNGGVESHHYQFADWGRTSKSWVHHYRFDRQARTFAGSGHRTDDLSLLADETYRNGRWQGASAWQVFRRGWSSDFTENSSMSALQVQNRILRSVSPTRTWELQQSTGLTVAGGTNSQSHSLGGRYSLIAGRFTVSPYANIALQSSDSIRVFAPQAGVTATWNATRGRLNAVMSGSAASLILNSDRGDSWERDSTLTAGAGTTLAFHPSRGVNVQLDTYLARNELRKSGETISANSVLIPIGGAGTEDRTQARMTLGKNWRPFGVHLYVDWLSRNAAGELQVNPFSSETLSSSLQLTLRRFGLLMSAGEMSLEQTRLQEISFVTAAARLALGRSLSLTVRHREELRMAVGEPEVDGSRSEAGVSLRIGSYWIEPQAFVSEQMSNGLEQSNRGLTVTVTRGFGGALPIITGTRRRGVVR